MGVAFLLALIAAAAAPVLAGSTPKAIGMWQVRDGRAKVKVDRCGKTLCARIVWLKEPNDDAGQPLTDGNNVDPAQRNRPILQLPVAYNMVQQSETYWTGAVYDPERGKAYDGSLRLLDDGRLEVKGCVLFLCESNYWQRIKDQPAVVTGEN
jgi:uncharacterized protein (DUF2147 family)